MNNKKTMPILLMVLLALSLQGCAGLIIGAATDATIAVAKVPFKIGGAVLDVVTDDDEED
ncbi:MAG: NF038104 family lipoprotein [Thiolinea sp.]